MSLSTLRARESLPTSSQQRLVFSEAEISALVDFKINRPDTKVAKLIAGRSQINDMQSYALGESTLPPLERLMYKGKPLLPSTPPFDAKIFAGVVHLVSPGDGLRKVVTIINKHCIYAVNTVQLLYRCFPGLKEGFDGAMTAYIADHLNQGDFQPTREAVGLVAQQTQLQDGSLTSLLVGGLNRLVDTQSDLQQNQRDMQQLMGNYNEHLQSHDRQLASQQMQITSSRQQIASLEGSQIAIQARQASLEERLQAGQASLEERLQALENSRKEQGRDRPSIAPTIIPESPQSATAKCKSSKAAAGASVPKTPATTVKRKSTKATAGAPVPKKPATTVKRKSTKATTAAPVPKTPATAAKRKSTKATAGTPVPKTPATATKRTTRTSAKASSTDASPVAY